MDILISAIKIISMLATGAFGVLGLLTKYKDDSGRITRWGKFALSGVVLSAVLSLFLYGLEASRATAAAKKAQNDAEATATVLKDILLSAKTNLAQQKVSLDETVKLKSGLDETLKEQKENSRRTIGISQDMSIALEQQRENLSQSRDTAHNMAVSLDTQRTLLAAQGRVQRQVVRAYYPLEPLTIFYEVEYPMDQPALAKYANRLRKEFASVPDSELAKVWIDVTSPDHKWKPGDAVEEEAARSVLLFDDTVFEFTRRDSHGTSKLSFLSMPDSQGLIAMPSKGKIRQDVKVLADFSRRIFIQQVRCDNPLRGLGDALSISAIDLVGRNLTWESMRPGASIRQLKKLALKFPNDSEASSTLRYITPARDIKSVLITASDVGLAEVFSDTEIPLKR